MKQSLLSKNNLSHKKATKLDIGLIAILVLIGLTSFFALYNAFNLIKTGSGIGNLSKQIMWYSFGFLVLFGMHNFKNEALLKFLPKIYAFLMGVLIYLTISALLIRISGGRLHLPFAPSINGAVSWIQIPGISFQPSEFMKVVLIIETSRLIAKYQKNHTNPTWKDDMNLFMQIARIALPPLLLIFFQPDTGVCMIIAFTLIILTLCSGIRPFYIWITLGAAVTLIGGFFYLYFYHHDILASIFASYRLNRIEAWLHPELYIRGSSNQLYTALLSLGSAGLSGYGLQANIISIPEAHTDFIFAAFGQCFGLMGTTFILVICALLDFYLCYMAIRVKHRMNKFIIIGTIAMLVYQQIQNLGMIVGLLPITGITLPLISYGGSSTLSYFLLFGLILNMPEVDAKAVPQKRAQRRVKKSV